MRLSIGVAACAAALVLGGCAGSRTAQPVGAKSDGPTPAAFPAGPVNALVSRAGTSGAVPLDQAQRSELDAVVARAPRSLRGRLRYAIANADDGSRRLVVYDGAGLGASGRYPGRSKEYVVFRVINSARGEHYDPQQNAIVEPIPVPAQRQSAVSSP